MKDNDECGGKIRFTDVSSKFSAVELSHIKAVKLGFLLVLFSSSYKGCQPCVTKVSKEITTAYKLYLTVLKYVQFIVFLL